MQTRKSYDKSAHKVTIEGPALEEGFQHQIRWKAEENQLSGYLRAEQPQQLTVVLQGLGYQIDNMMEWLRHGDHGVHISRMHRAPTELEDHSGFDIHK